MNETTRKQLKSAGIDLPESPDFLSVWELLPRTIEKSHSIYWLKLDKDEGLKPYSRIAYEGLHEHRLLSCQTSERVTLVDAAGQLLAQLVEKGLLS